MKMMTRLLSIAVLAAAVSRASSVAFFRPAQHYKLGDDSCCHSRELSLSVVLSSPRGGGSSRRKQQHETKEEAAIREEVTVDAAQLYLPGLLDTVLTRSSKVCLSFLLWCMFPSFHSNQTRTHTHARSLFLSLSLSFSLFLSLSLSFSLFTHTHALSLHTHTLSLLRTLFGFPFIQPTSALDDFTVSISPKKAAELNVALGDLVVIVGRRRRAMYGRVAIASKGQTTSSSINGKEDACCVISANMASNLRLRHDDKLKLVVPGAEEKNGESPSQDSVVAKDDRSGDLLLVSKPNPSIVASVTFAPLEDSIAALQSSEGGDDISDDEILRRFLKPYTDGADGVAALVKKGHLLTLRDDSGRRLEVVVSHVELESDSIKEGGDSSGMC
jgi:hypothetical protein